MFDEGEEHQELLNDAPELNCTFGDLINVTKQQDALMAYYYLDENNQMQVTEIFDMSATMPTGGQEGLPWNKEQELNFGDITGLDFGSLTDEEVCTFDSYRAPSLPEADQHQNSSRR